MREKKTKKRYLRAGSVHKLSILALTKRWCSQAEFSCSFKKRSVRMKRNYISPFETENKGCVHKQNFLALSRRECVRMKRNYILPFWDKKIKGVSAQNFLAFLWIGCLHTIRKAEPFSLFKTPGREQNKTMSIERNEGGFTSEKI